MSRKVVITDCDFGNGDLEREELGESFSVELAHAKSEEDVIRAGSHADGLFVQWAPVGERVFAALPRLRAIVRYGIGLDTIDLDAASRHGVTVMNVPDYCIDEVATHAHSMILAANRNLFEYVGWVDRGGWSPTEIPIPLPISADPVGIVGLGRVGIALARRLSACGHPVGYWDPFVSDPPINGVQRFDELIDLAKAVNHLTLHLPATNETIGLIDGPILWALGPHGHLVNTGRGSIVNESDLLEALDGGLLGRASLDVLAEEPPVGRSVQLVQHPRVRVTPHVAYLSEQSLPTLRRNAARSLRQALS